MDSTHRARAGWRYASGKGVSTGQAEGGGGGGRMRGNTPKTDKVPHKRHDQTSRTSELKAATQYGQLMPLLRPARHAISGQPPTRCPRAELSAAWSACRESCHTQRRWPPEKRT